MSSGRPRRQRLGSFASFVSSSGGAVHVCALASLVACGSLGCTTADDHEPASQEADATRSTLFDRAEPLAFRIEAPLGEAFEKASAGLPNGPLPGMPRRSKDPFVGTLTYATSGGAEVTLPIELKVRGNSSLSECSFPKLTIKIRKGDLAGAPLGPFAGDTKFKLGTHCGEDASGTGQIGRLRHETAAHREAAVYGLLGTILTGTADEPALHARAARVTYVDTSAGTAGEPLERDAFVLEDLARLAKRLGAADDCRTVDGEEECDPVLKDSEVFALDPAALPLPNVALLGAFHALVGNWDYSLGTALGGGKDTLWNTDVAVFGAPDAPRMLPVAQDFDLASAVTGKVRGAASGAPDALRDQAEKYLSNLDALPPDVRSAALDRLRSRKAAVLEAAQRLPMDDAGRAILIRHVETFYAVLER